MKYILIIQGALGEWESLDDWPAAARDAHIAFMRRLNEQLSRSRELVHVHALKGPEDATIVRGTSGGEPAITDGPFPESKEFLAGFWIVDVESRARALEIAAQASLAPRPGGAPVNIPIEVRAVMSAPGEG